MASWWLVGSSSMDGRSPGFLVPAGGSAIGERGRPARLYREGDADSLHPALLRGSSGAYD